jgi:hypothetical protein
MGEQLEYALDLMRRMPPSQIEDNLAGLIDLVPNLVEDLLSAVDQPLKVAHDKESKRDYLLCDYNRDGDSYRFLTLPKILLNCIASFILRIDKHNPALERFLDPLGRISMILRCLTVLVHLQSCAKWRFKPTKRLMFTVTCKSSLSLSVEIWCLRLALTSTDISFSVHVQKKITST